MAWSLTCRGSLQLAHCFRFQVVLFSVTVLGGSHLLTATETGVPTELGMKDCEIRRLSEQRSWRKPCFCCRCWQQQMGSQQTGSTRHWTRTGPGKLMSLKERAGAKPLFQRTTHAPTLLVHWACSTYEEMPPVRALKCSAWRETVVGLCEQTSYY